ncbi:hypothetical protein ACJMK2_006753 [Sinanodonta woodiana]|uniref:Mab-21-like nucleotidyltransferase domain-containing protein n=1 Tax=Sinanodonta woodiana TaxID=1069815 RepID=A0ABD3VU35_SINWO
MASHVTTEIERNENIYPSFRIISSNIEKMMSFEGFDLARKMFQTWISWQEIVSSLCDTTQISYGQIYGSLGEGIIYPLDAPCDRDVDIVYVLPNNIAIENVHETHLYGSETRIYLIENVPNRPGYCYLRVITEGSMFIFPNSMISLTKEVYGCQYFSGLTLKEMVKTAMTIGNTPISYSNQIRDMCDNPNLDVKELDQQGPATFFRFKAQMQNRGTVFNLKKCDHVYVVQCPKWPSSALEWVNRNSRSGWPCQKLKQEIVQRGILLAPVGCKQDPSQDIQWRYSFNEAERRLVTSFNGTQAKCYALLKRIISEFVKPWFSDDVITSYHLKTLMFWTVEEIDFQAWVPAKLVECIFIVLKRLTQCIEDEICPSYFIPNENLFQERATLVHKADVLAIMHNILSEGWLVLFRLPSFSMKYNVISTIHEYVWTRFDIIHNAVCFADWYQLLSSQIELFLINMYHAELDIYKIHETGRIDTKFSEIIHKLTTKIYSFRDERIKEVLKNVTARLCSSYGTQCLSLARVLVSDMSRKIRTDEFAGERYIEMSCLRNQLECLVKRANYAYMCGKFQSTISTAFDLLQRYLHLSVRAFNSDIPVNVQCRPNFPHSVNCEVQMFSAKNSSHLIEIFGNLLSSNEVIFAKNEIYAVPGNVKVEMFKVGIQEDHVNPLSKFQQRVVVDPYFYVTFLAFQVYYDMEINGGADTVIETMESICSEPPNSHLPTSLNLLGDCYLKTGKIYKAMEKFKLSMKRKNWRNAAPWHIARLVWRKLLDRWSQTREEDV